MKLEFMRAMKSFYKVVFPLIALSAVGCSSGGSSSSSVTNTTAVETCFNVAVNYTGSNQTKKICTTKENGGYNGLGVNRFFTFSLSETKTVNISATRTSGLDPADPDLAVFKDGALVAVSESTEFNLETLTTTYGAGDYSVELREYNYAIASNKTLPAKYQEVELAKGVEPVFQAPSTTCTDTTNVGTVSGVFKFERVNHSLLGASLDYGNITPENGVGLVIQVMCGDGVYDEGVTQSDGSYNLNYQLGQTSTIRVIAQMKSTTPSYNFKVVDNTVAVANKPTYVFDWTNTFISAGDTGAITIDPIAGHGAWTGTEYAEVRAAAPFAILDSIRQAKDKVVAAGVNTFPPLNINWSPDNTTASGDILLGEIGTSFFNGSEIYLLGKEDNDTDEYDGHVIIHEWGHYFEHNFSRADSIGGPHSSSDILDIRVAFSEGFGNAFSGMVTDDSKYIDVSGDNQSVGFIIDVERNNCSNPGWFSECSVQSTLYDIYDSGLESNDGLALGFGPIFEILTNQQRETKAFTSIFSFIKPLKENNGASANAIDALTSAQDIDPILDIYGDSETTNNPGATDQLPVHVAF